MIFDLLHPHSVRHLDFLLFRYLITSLMTLTLYSSHSSTFSMWNTHPSLFRLLAKRYSVPWTVLHCGTTTRPSVGQIVHAAMYGVYAHTRCSATLLQGTTATCNNHYRYYNSQYNQRGNYRFLGVSWWNFCNFSKRLINTNIYGFRLTPAVRAPNNIQTSQCGVVKPFLILAKYL